MLYPNVSFRRFPSLRRNVVRHTNEEKENQRDNQHPNVKHFDLSILYILPSTGVVFRLLFPNIVFRN